MARQARKNTSLVENLKRNELVVSHLYEGDIHIFLYNYLYIDNIRRLQENIKHYKHELQKQIEKQAFNKYKHILYCQAMCVYFVSSAMTNSPKTTAELSETSMFQSFAMVSSVKFALILLPFFSSIYMNRVPDKLCFFSGRM